MRIRVWIAFLSLALAATLTVAAAQPVRPATILLVGANGMIGSRILAEAASRGHHVLAASREPDKIAGGANIEPVKLDATDQAAFIAMAKKADVIIMATSSRASGNPMQDAKAIADTAIAAARASGARLLMVGGASSLKFPDGRPILPTMPADLRNGEAGAKDLILATLRTSDIDWTFVSPAMDIAPGTHTGVYRFGTDTALFDKSGVSHISAEDYADGMISEVEKPAHRRMQMTIGY